MSSGGNFNAQPQILEGQTSNKSLTWRLLWSSRWLKDNEVIKLRVCSIKRTDNQSYTSFNSLRGHGEDAEAHPICAQVKAATPLDHLCRGVGTGLKKHIWRKVHCSRVLRQWLEGVLAPPPTFWLSYRCPTLNLMSFILIGDFTYKQRIIVIKSKGTKLHICILFVTTSTLGQSRTKENRKSCQKAKQNNFARKTNKKPDFVVLRSLWLCQNVERWERKTERACMATTECWPLPHNYR